MQGAAEIFMYETIRFVFIQVVPKLSDKCRLNEITYLSGWDLNSNLLDGLGELVWLHGAIVVQIEVLESLHEDLLLGLGSSCLLRQLVLEFSLKTTETNGVTNEFKTVANF